VKRCLVAVEVVVDDESWSSVLPLLELSLIVVSLL
jgi:hypothetical protein